MSRIEEIRAELKACDDAHAAYDADEDGCWGNDEHPKSIAYRDAARAVSDGAYYKIRDLLAEVDRCRKVVNLAIEHNDGHYDSDCECCHAMKAALDEYEKGGGDERCVDG